MYFLHNLKFSFPIKNVPALVGATIEMPSYTFHMFEVKNNEKNVDSNIDYAYHRTQLKIKQAIVSHLLSFKGESNLLPTEEDVVEFLPHYSEIDLVDDAEDSYASRYVEDINSKLILAVKRNMFALRNCIHVKFEHLGKVELMWVIYGDPELIRYLTVSGDNEAMVAEPSLDVRVKGKLFMFPLVLNSLGENKTFCEVEVTDVQYCKAKEDPEDNTLKGEHYIKVTTTLPVLTCFNLELKRKL